MHSNLDAHDSAHDSKVCDTTFIVCDLRVKLAEMYCLIVNLKVIKRTIFKVCSSTKTEARQNVGAVLQMLRARQTDHVEWRETQAFGGPLSFGGLIVTLPSVTLFKVTPAAT
ncbi:hypothetical protein EVAR_31632_1 [Eumeta japonica]|uniref:Uncharacterized protein n=1 Tax=Eumeta variegata TaxID=151549 RepID=A0A4C1VYS5_EUMVA|nr:hypothetical protein EVAR_31632_1 [Eumeta japonica]